MKECGLAALDTRILRGNQIEVFFKYCAVMQILKEICSSNLKKAVVPEDTK